MSIGVRVSFWIIRALSGYMPSSSYRLKKVISHHTRWMFKVVRSSVLIVWLNLLVGVSSFCLEFFAFAWFSCIYFCHTILKQCSVSSTAFLLRAISWICFEQCFSNCNVTMTHLWILLKWILWFSRFELALCSEFLMAPTEHILGDKI